MSVATSIAAITDSRNTIRNKMVSMGLAVGTDKLDDLATKLAAVVDNGAVDIEIQEGDTYTIPAGYHNGSGTVSGVAGGGNYTLQSKECTPTKAQQSIVPDQGKYGLSSVTVAAIPDAYQDVSSTTATAADVKAGSVFVAADGTTTTGTMPVNAAQTIDVAVDDEQVLTAGYYAGITINGPTLSGDAAVANVLAGKTFYSDSGTQLEGTMTNNGAVDASVAVGGTYTVPAGYHDGTGTVTGPVLDGDAAVANVLASKTFYASSGTKLTGTMVNNGAVTATIDGLTTSSYTIPAGYHDGTGTVSLTSDIEDALDAI